MKTFLLLLLISTNVYSKEIRIVQKDPYGNMLYHKQQYVITNDKIYKVDSIGNIQYHKGSLQIETSRKETKNVK